MFPGEPYISMSRWPPHRRQRYKILHLPIFLCVGQKLRKSNSSKQIISYQICLGINRLIHEDDQNIRVQDWWCFQVWFHTYVIMISVIPIKNLTWIELTAAVAWGDDREFLSPSPLFMWLQHNWGFYSTRIYTQHCCVILISHICNTFGLLIPRVPHNCSIPKIPWTHKEHTSDFFLRLDQGE